MKIALIYFEEKLSENRNHHTVNSNMLFIWQYYYDKSGSRSRPCLLLDNKTSVPDFWKYDHIVVEDCMPHPYKDVLNKVGWMKHQAFDLLGKCVVMDVDAILKLSIDDLSSLPNQIAMAPDPGTYRKWPWCDEWPSARFKYNAGVLYMNSGAISGMFKEMWLKYTKHIDITYFDEIIFSAILHEMSGKVLDTEYNTIWDGADKDTRVLHFSGNRKQELYNYIISSIP